MEWYEIIQVICAILMAIAATIFLISLVVQKKKIIYVEDGSISASQINTLEDNGYIVIIYRQGSRPPEVLK